MNAPVEQTTAMKTLSVKTQSVHSLAPANQATPETGSTVQVSFDTYY